LAKESLFSCISLVFAAGSSLLLDVTTRAFCAESVSAICGPVTILSMLLFAEALAVARSRPMALVLFRAINNSPSA
jgi:hypothetical protein